MSQQVEATPEVLARAKELLAKSRGNNSQGNEPVSNGVPVEVTDQELEKHNPNLQPHDDPMKAPPLNIPGITPANSQQVIDAQRQERPQAEIKVRRSEQNHPDNNKIDIWEDKVNGRWGITINDQIFEVQEPVYQLFMRMVSQIRTISGDLETERANILKLKQSMASAQAS